MSWGSGELEPEVVEWLEALPDDQFGRVEFYIDLLADRGVELGEPYTRHLGGKLRELRFYLGPSGDAVRISYYITTGPRIILLTVFRKQRQRERAEVGRARRAMERCIAEGHTVEGTDEWAKELGGPQGGTRRYQGAANRLCRSSRSFRVGCTA